MAMSGKTVKGPESSSGSKPKQAKRQVSKDIFLKRQRVYERDHQSSTGCRLTWMMMGLSFQRFGVLLAESMSLGFVGRNTFLEHG